MPSRIDIAVRAYRERLLATGRPEDIVNQDLALLQMSLVEANVQGALDLNLGPSPKREEPSFPPFPKSWSEAQSEVPNLMRWSAAKRMGQTIVEHMGNEDTGYGRWTRHHPAGLPRATLLLLDGLAHKELADFLAVEGNSLPPDVKVRKHSERIAEERAGFDRAQVLKAQRLNSSYTRAKAKLKGQGMEPPGFDLEEVREAQRKIAWYKRHKKVILAK